LSRLPQRAQFAVVEHAGADRFFSDQPARLDAVARGGVELVWRATLRISAPGEKHPTIVQNVKPLPWPPPPDDRLNQILIPLTTDVLNRQVFPVWKKLSPDPALDSLRLSLFAPVDVFLEKRLDGVGERALHGARFRGALCIGGLSFLLLDGA